MVESKLKLALSPLPQMKAKRWGIFLEESVVLVRTEGVGEYSWNRGSDRDLRSLASF